MGGWNGRRRRRGRWGFVGSRGRLWTARNLAEARCEWRLQQRDMTSTPSELTEFGMLFCLRARRRERHILLVA